MEPSKALAASLASRKGMEVLFLQFTPAPRQSALRLPLRDPGRLPCSWRYWPATSRATGRYRAREQVRGANTGHQWSVCESTTQWHGVSDAGDVPSRNIKINRSDLDAAQQSLNEFAGNSSSSLMHSRNRLRHRGSRALGGKYLENRRVQTTSVSVGDT